MKKIVLSLAGVMAAIAFAPEASAVPVFARQTGMACSACHFQHFPLLNGFGRAFKASGYTMMGAQGTVEGEEHAKLSIPSTLNMGVLTTTGYESVSGATANTGGKNAAWFVPGSGGELSLFIGGRVSEFAGFLTELGMGAAAATGAAKLALLYPVGDSRMGVVAHTSNGQGVAYSYETLNTGAVNTHKMTTLNGNNQGANLGGTNAALVAARAAANVANAAVTLAAGGAGPTLAQLNAAAVANAALAAAAGAANYTNGGHTGVYSAAQFLGTATPATGLSFVASNPTMGFVNIGKYEVAGVGTANAGTLPLTYVRVAGLFEAAGFDMAAGIQSFSGTSKVVATAAGAAKSFKATVVDFQAQGEVRGMPLGVYTSYGTAPGDATGAGLSGFNGGTFSRNSWGIGAELGVIPHVSTLQLSIRRAKSGIAGNSGANTTDNAYQIGATYELAQNMELSLTHTAASGSIYSDVPAGTTPVGKTITSLMLEALF